ncbi:YbjQ family protein [Salininema proteolyticum]|uniref:UPF0145 protein ACFPET_00285 n=1 Tax=Salininema proteolyticum TaxID=1607685 RepID=A0ABV8TSP9_9ACTN
MTIIDDQGGAMPAQDIIVTTTENVPGHSIDRVYGEVFGVTVRSRNFVSDFGAGVKSIFGGELKGLTKALVASREQATERMIDKARDLGANAVVMMRFDVTDARDIGTEVCAYGTAVSATPK